MTHTSIQYRYTLEDVLSLGTHTARTSVTVEAVVIIDAQERYIQDTGKPWPDAPYLSPAVDCSLEDGEYVVEIHS